MGVRGTADTPPLEPGRSAPPATLRRVGLAPAGRLVGPRVEGAPPRHHVRTALVIASYPLLRELSRPRRAHRDVVLLLPFEVAQEARSAAPPAPRGRAAPAPWADAG